MGQSDYALEGEERGGSGDFEQLQIFFFGDELQGFADIVDIVLDGHAAVLPNGVAFGKRLGHDGEQFDPLVEDVVDFQ